MEPDVMDNMIPIETNDKERNVRLKAKVLEEIISSELSYLSQLDMLLNGFVRPVREMNLLPKNKFSSIFGDIEPLYNLNRTLYEEMLSQDRQGNIGNAFLKIAPYLKLYSTYAHDYEIALKLLQDLRKSNKEFEAFVCQQERLASISQKLEALLITPIQRVPRYVLLISQLIVHTEEEEEQRILTTAKKQIESVAKHINEQIREQQNMQRIIQLQKSLAHGRPKIVYPGRRIIHEGTLKKVSDKDSAHQRYFVLFNDMLLYCKVRRSDINQRGSLLCSCILPLRHCKAEAVIGDGLFRVTCREERLLLCSNTAEEGRKWVDVINETIQQLEKNYRTLKKESSSRRPQKKRQLPQQESLLQVLHQRQLVEKRAAKDHSAADELNIENLTHDAENESRIVDAPNAPKSPRTFKFPKWPGACPGSPLSPHSSLKMLGAAKPTSPAANQTFPVFYSPPIQQ